MKIDYFVLSHDHADHVRGLPALAKMIPIGHYYDHGDTVDEVDRPRLDLYKQVVGSSPRTSLKPGDTVPLKGIKAQVVASTAASSTNRSLDQGVGGARWHVHDHERAQRFQQDLRGAVVSAGPSGS
jgi:beta-lactamase superfamily II metal-dependent hydrolase